MDSTYKLTSTDWVKTLSTTVVVAVLTVVYGVVSQTGFDVFSTDWVAVGKLVVNTTVVTFVGRLMERFVTDQNGAVFGVWGGSKN